MEPWSTYLFLYLQWDKSIEVLNRPIRKWEVVDRKKQRSANCKIAYLLSQCSLNKMGMIIKFLWGNHNRRSNLFHLKKSLEEALPSSSMIIQKEIWSHKVSWECTEINDQREMPKILQRLPCFISGPNLQVPCFLHRQRVNQGWIMKIENHLAALMTRLEQMKTILTSRLPNMVAQARKVDLQVLININVITQWWALSLQGHSASCNLVILLQH